MLRNFKLFILIQLGLIFCVASVILIIQSCKDNESVDWSTKWLGQQTVNGYVFEDLNKDGIKNDDEKGIPGIMVSNQEKVVKTDHRGFYVLPVDTNNIIFITKPAGYNIPVDSNNLPQFYYIHQPNGSPDTLKYEGVSPTGELPERVNFPLYKTIRLNSCKAIIVGDPQMRDDREIDFFRDDIVAEMMGKDCTFYLALGDVAYDNLNIYRRYKIITGKIGIPVYNTPGNHDMNYKGSCDDYALETYKNHFGPNYYSFDYGMVHFIVLDNVEWYGEGRGYRWKRKYRGKFGNRQLEWLKNDLSYAPENFLVVLAMHIPIYSEVKKSERSTIADREELFEILKNREHLLALAGHNHKIEHVILDTTTGWWGKAEFHEIICGAGCGCFWNGPLDERGIPVSTGMDGSPNGYYIFSFENNQYDYHYYPANHDRDYQVRIISPIGTIEADSLSNVKVLANIFNADKQSIVQYQIDNLKPIKMGRVVMVDPFIADLREKYDDCYRDWIQPIKSSHIWKASIPLNLKHGIHTIQIKALDRMGHNYIANGIFERE